MKRTYHPSRRRFKTTHGFLSRQARRHGRQLLRRRIQKGRHRV